MITFSELQIKEVIHINTGEKLGHIADLEITPESGKIHALIIFGRDGTNLFRKSDEIIIYWDQIRTIGTDVILVED